MSYVPSGHLPDGHLPTGHIPEVTEGESTPAPVDVRQRFAVAFPFFAADATDFRTFPPAVKDPSEDLLVELDLYLWCANFWRANEQVALNEHVRPRRPTGFAYKATVAGTTGMREPSYWPRTIGLTVVSGSVTFSTVAAEANGLSPVTDPVAVPDPTGLTMTGVSASESTKIIATYQGGTVERDYDAVFSFTLNGAPRVARQKVMVRKR